MQTLAVTAQAEQIPRWAGGTNILLAVNGQGCDLGVRN
jgi:hypothetical protein